MITEFPKPEEAILVQEYDPAWVVAFDELKTVIGRVLGELALRIEHVGSTSVPGLAAKPIIDMNVVIATRDDLPKVVARLETLGYTHNGDQGIPGREAFKRNQDPTVPHNGSGKIWPLHHLYVCAQDAAELARHMAFRDYLRRHPEAVAQYAAIKRGLARQYTYAQMQDYVDGKDDFIKGVYRQIFEAASDESQS